MGKILISKLFAGSFNDDNIGHEVINLYKHDQTNDEELDNYHFIYIAPYGSVGKKGCSNDYDFLNSIQYKSCDRVLFVSKTDIPYTFKIIAFAKELEKFNNGAEINYVASRIKYNGKVLNNISFVNHSEDEEEMFDDTIVSKLTYKVKKEYYYDLRPLNLFIYAQQNTNARAKENYNLNLFNQLHPNGRLELLQNLNTWHNSTTANADLTRWIEENIERHYCNVNYVFNLPDMFSNRESQIIYNNENILKFIDKENDENIVTNMLQKILSKCPKIARYFVNYIKEKSNITAEWDDPLLVAKQQSSLLENERLINHLLNVKKIETKNNIRNELLTRFHYTQEQIGNYEHSNIKFKEGYMDLYLEGNSYRIVVENKVKSGLNDVYVDDENNQITQLNKYAKYLEGKNEAEAKNNIIILMAPDYHCNFATNIDGTNISCYLIKYSELYYLFTNIPICDVKIDSTYYGLFINSLAKHSRTLENEIRERFINITK